MRNEYLGLRIEGVLDKYLPSASEMPINLHQAMRYAVFNGGKRLRPLLIYATGEAFGADISQLDIVAAAIEFIHCYTLAHDDLPAFDNDDYRRGKLACHKKFDEATAILAGSTLYNLAFSIIVNSKLITDKQKIVAMQILTATCGSEGLAGGQMLDLEYATKKLSEEQLLQVYQMKTGVLLKACMKLATTFAPNITTIQNEKIEQLADNLGIAYQIQDDIFDSEQSEDELSYVKLFGTEAAKNKLHSLINNIQNTIHDLAINQSALANLIKYILEREY